jgi:hypothetical protein
MFFKIFNICYFMIYPILFQATLVIQTYILCYDMLL